MIQAPQTQYIPAQMPMPQTAYPQSGAYNQIQYPQTAGYFYNYPTSSCYVPAAQNGKQQYNGVNIEIINPQGQGYVPGSQVSMPAPQPINIPFQPIYAQPQPVQPIEQQIPAAVQTMPQQVSVTQQPVPPVIPQPQIPQAAPAAVPAAPQMIQPQPQQPAAAAPVIDTPVTTQQSSISPESFAGRLKSNDLDQQQSAIEEIAQYVKNDGTEGNELLDSVIFDALVDIINKDTSNLKGPSDEVKELRNKAPEDLTPSEKELAETPCEMEKAQMNKQFALYTISFMQERLNKELKQTLPLQDLPCIDIVINTIKSDPDPQIRTAGISSLVHIAQPEYKEYLTTIFELAQADEDERVKESAKKALEQIKSI